MAIRMMYTQYTRRNSKLGLSPASNALHTLEKEAIITETFINEPIIFPQYLSHTPTTLTVREDTFPSSFTVTEKSKPIFKVHRHIPSLHHQQDILDARTNSPVMSIRRNLASLPRSFTFLDSSGNRIVDLQGNFFVPFTGAKSTVILLNAAGQTMELSMQGSFQNRYAVIKNLDGEELVTMRSEFELRDLIGRRTYIVDIRGGVDMAVVVGLIVALDARA